MARPREYEFSTAVQDQAMFRQSAVCAMCGVDFRREPDLYSFHHLIPNQVGERAAPLMPAGLVGDFEMFMTSADNCVMLCTTGEDCHFHYGHGGNTRTGGMVDPAMLVNSHGPGGRDSAPRRAWVARVRSFWIQVAKTPGL